MSKLKLGIYGGTFSPPHNGHVKSALDFVLEMKLDKLLIIPTFIPPHKEYNGEVSGKKRLEMCQLAFSSIKGCEVCDIEIKRGGLSYTYITLEELYSDKVELFLLVGTDMLLTLDEWNSPERIFELANICYVRRENDKQNDFAIEAKIKEYKDKFNARIYPVNSKVLELSSTEIRKMVSRGESVGGFVPDKVADYIEEEGLYK